MLQLFKRISQTTAVVVGLASCSCFAAGNLMDTSAEKETHEQSWTREQHTEKQNPLFIVQQKAQARAEQRQQRIATCNWYGISTSRPAGLPTPFTARYGSVWEMPGGKPFSWYPPNTQPG